MRVQPPDELANRAITEFESQGATVAVIARGDRFSVVRIKLKAGGRLGMHEAAAPQLLIVVEGEGTVLTAGATSKEVSTGTTVCWDAGELHETRSETGLTAIVIEAAAIGSLGTDPFGP